jgi:hypothetical protein
LRQAKAFAFSRPRRAYRASGLVLGSMAVDRDRLKRADSDLWPNGGNGRDSGRTRAAA